MSGSGTTDPIKKAYEGIPNWVGFGLIIAAGVTLVVVGAVLPQAGVIAFGVATLASAIIAWVSGASAKPEVDPKKKTFGGTVKEIRQIPWIVIFALYVAAVIVTILTA
jgi:hypothetical protein